MLAPKYLVLLAVTGFIVALDQSTKMYIHTNFFVGESTVVIKDFFSITYVRNPAAAFGFLGGLPQQFRELFFLIVPPLAVAFIVYVLKTTPWKFRLQILSLSLVCGGAVGNYIDRIRFRYVVDFLDFHYQRLYTYPAFNVADISIVTGICLLLLMSFLQKDETATED